MIIDAPASGIGIGHRGRDAKEDATTAVAPPNQSRAALTEHTRGELQPRQVKTMVKILLF
jgi:hypothetical protein